MAFAKLFTRSSRWRTDRLLKNTPENRQNDIPASNSKEFSKRRRTSASSVIIEANADIDWDDNPCRRRQFTQLSAQFKTSGLLPAAKASGLVGSASSIRRSSAGCSIFRSV